MDRPYSFAMYLRPTDLKGATDALSLNQAMILCGGTDVFPARVGEPMPERILDLSAIPELRAITEAETEVRIGAAATWSSIIAAPLPRAFNALKAAAREVGSVQIQNRGTIGGNLCNASPAADGVPPLLALDAEVEIASRKGVRRMALASFITGYRKTALARGEILSAVIVRKRAMDASSVFMKLGARRYLVISIVMVAVNLVRDAAGVISDARIAVGSASEVAMHLGALERALIGYVGVRPSSLLQAAHLEPLRPIDDVRATAVYRNDAALTLVGRALDAAAFPAP
jgi:CO/xanthine dehydrogenase FAD-binding subunit